MTDLRGSADGSGPVGQGRDVRPGGGGGLRLERLTKRFGAVVAVQDLTLAVTPGEIYGLIGPNGSGKTTTVKMLAGLYRPTAGRILIDGVDLGVAPERANRALGYVPDEPFVWWGSCTGSRGRRGTRASRGFWSGFPWPTPSTPTPSTTPAGTGRSSRSWRHWSTSRGSWWWTSRSSAWTPRARSRPGSSSATSPPARGAVLLCTHSLAFAEGLCHRVGLLRAGRLVREGTLGALRAAAGLPAAPLEALYLHLVRPGPEGPQSGLSGPPPGGP